jgi:hypothetical protein
MPVVEHAMLSLVLVRFNAPPTADNLGYSFHTSCPCPQSGRSSRLSQYAEGNRLTYRHIISTSCHYKDLRNSLEKVPSLSAHLAHILWRPIADVLMTFLPSYKLFESWLFP